MRDQLLRRTYIILGGMLILASVLGIRTAQIGVIDRDEWLSLSDSLTLVNRKLTPKRGNIYSENDNLLATSVSYFDLHMDLNTEAMTDEIFYGNVDSLAWYLSTYLMKEYTPTELKNRLVSRRKAKDRYFKLKRNVTFETLEQVKNFPLIREGKKNKYRGGLIVERTNDRIYPYGQIALRTVGKIRENAPDYGMESYFDNFLRGEDGIRVEEKIAGNIYVPVDGLMDVEPKNGDDVYTTLNVDIQEVAHQALKRTLEKYDAELGCVIVMDVESGGIKAMSNLKKTSSGEYRDVQNFAVGATYEPGSTFKLATMVSLFDDYHVDLDHPVNLEGGKVKYGKHYIHDSEKHNIYESTLLEAFAISSNVGMAKLATEFYNTRSKQKRFQRHIANLKLGDKTGIEVPGEAKSSLRDSTKEWNYTYTLPWSSYGYTQTMTPLNIATFYNAVANNGMYVYPHLLKEVKSGSSVVYRYKAPKPKRIMSESAVKKSKILLEEVVKKGTADHLKTNKYNFAGKTGTTKLEYWKDQKPTYMGSFVGYFPAENPKYTCYVMVYKPKGYVYYGGHVAGPVFREIADFCHYYDQELIPSFVSEESIHASDELPVFEAGYSDDFMNIMKHLGLKISNNTSEKWAVLMQDSSGLEVRTRTIPEPKTTIPNVVGMTLKDALFLLENAGLDVRVDGYGRVRSQSPKGGASIRTEGNKVYIRLS